MNKKILCCAALAAHCALAASQVLLSHNILTTTRPNTSHGGSLTPLPNGAFRFTLAENAKDCWVHFPIDLKDLKYYDEIEIVIHTDQTKAAGLFELHVNQPSPHAMALKKNLRLQAGIHAYQWKYPHAGVSAPPEVIRFRLTNHLDNYHLPQSEINGPIDFEAICFQVTTDGIDRLQKSFEALYDTARYQPLGATAVAAANQERDALRLQVNPLLTTVRDSKAQEDARLTALEQLYELQSLAGWRIEQAALKGAPAEVIVGVTGGADKIFRAERFPGRFSAPVRMELAQREMESAQIALFPKKDLPKVTVQWTALKNAQGNEIPQAQISVVPMGYVKPQAAAYVTERTGQWIPDPILTETHQMNLLSGAYQPYWIDVRSTAQTPPGIYRGNVLFQSNGQALATIPLEVKVWGFELPEKLSLPTIISADYLGGNSNFPKMYSDDAQAIEQWNQYMWSEHPEQIKLSPEAKRLVDISEQTRLLYREHRIPYNDIYRGVEKVHPAWKRRLILEDDGMHCLGYDKGRHKLDALTPEIENMRKEGTVNRAYIYGYDEITSLKAFQGMKRSYAELRKLFPDILYTAVALDYTFGELTDTVDTLDAWIIPPTEYLESLPAIQRARERGKKVWWYPCNWPFPPDANLLQENVATATRLIIGFMAWKY